MKVGLKILFATFFVLAGVVAAQAENRIALVIGNSAYKDSPLTNPRNDARLIAQTLRKVGFDVKTLIDGDHRAMKLAMVRFGRALRASDTVGLFYYAGHGVQARGENYLIPVDAEIIDESEIDVFAINVNDYLRTMERASSRINIVVLDACRNNPFARSFRSQTRGLARVDAPRGTYIAYATAPGQVALDGKGQNSPYTAALADAITTPGLTIEETFKQARRVVLAATDERQTPWETSSITGRFYFKKAPPKPQITKEELTWSLVRNSTNPALVQAYLDSYPQGKYAGEARAAIVRLAREREEQRAEEEAERQRIEAEQLAKLEAATKAEAERKARLEAAAKAKAYRLAKLEAERKARQEAEAALRQKRAEELADWQNARSSNSTAQLEAYLAKYPQGVFSDLAKARLSALNKLRVAALQPAVTSQPAEDRPAEATEIAPPISARELAKQVQQHLLRIGCNPGQPDGAWGRNSRSALQRYARHGKVKLAGLTPTPELLDGLAKRKGRICPLICGKREVLKRGRCIAKTCPRGQVLNRAGKCERSGSTREKARKEKPSKKQKDQAKERTKPNRRQAQKANSSGGTKCYICEHTAGNRGRYCGASIAAIKKSRSWVEKCWLR